MLEWLQCPLTQRYGIYEQDIISIEWWEKEAIRIESGWENPNFTAGHLRYSVTAHSWKGGGKVLVWLQCPLFLRSGI